MATKKSTAASKKAAPQGGALGPKASARRAGLRYVSDEEPGLTRKPWGRGFTYLDAEGNRITDEDERARIEALAIPPAWTEVWIAATPDAHLLSTGRDDKGRKQYIYHPEWQAARQRMKFDRLILFAQSLSQLRARCRHDLTLDGLPRDKVLAAVVRLLDRTLIRIGGDEYAQENDSFGLTTMRRRHVRFDKKGACTFSFAGKSGQEHEIPLDDPLLARIVQDCCDVPGYEIFAFFDEDEQKHDVKASHVNAYLRETTGEDFTAKHFRTWGGTVRAATFFHEAGPAEDEDAAQKTTVAMVKAVAEALGNTPAVCRDYYIHPAITEGYAEGTLLPAWRSFLEEEPAAQLEPPEHATLSFLRAGVVND